MGAPWHIKANGPRRRNFIAAQGHFTLQKDKQAELLRHFAGSLSTATPRPSSLHWDYLDILRHDLTSLGAPFSEEEVRAASAALPSGKAPGPDGFTANFFKHC